MTPKLQHTVYRINSGEKVLTNTNAANKLGVLYMLDRATKHDKLIGDQISVFEVSQSPEFGKYQTFRQGRPRPTDNPMVGMKVEKVIKGEEATYYSFPQDADWKAMYKGSVLLQDFYDACNEEDPLNDLHLDEQVEVLTELLERNNL